MAKIKKIIIFLSILISVVVGVLICFFTLNALGKIKNGINLEIKVRDREVIYNGEVQRANDYEIVLGLLSSGDIIEANYIDGARDIGTYTTTATFKVLHGNTDVTNNYNIKVDTGKLTILKNKITVSSLSEVYPSSEMIDDISLYVSKGSISLDEHLVPYEIDKYIDGDDFYNVGAHVYDNLGNDRSFNYDISFEATRVLKKKLIITTQSESFTYDGQEHSNTNYITSGLNNGDSLSLLNVNPTKVSTYNAEGYVNELRESEVVIVDSKGNDVTGNYDIEVINSGRLYINPLTVTITTSSENVIYDGEKHQGSYMVDNSLFEALVNSIETKIYVESGIYLNSVEIVASEDLLKNFDIHYSLGIINIMKKRVDVYLPTLIADVGDTKGDIEQKFSVSDVVISTYDYDVIGSISAVVADISYSTAGTYTYGGQILDEDVLANYDVIIHQGNIIVR